jgi:hypothetical protein
MTGLTLNRSLQRQGCLKPAHRVEKIDVHCRLDIPTSHRACRCRPAASKQSTQVAEDVAEIVDVLFVAARGPG